MLRREVGKYIPTRVCMYPANEMAHIYDMGKQTKKHIELRHFSLSFIFILLFDLHYECKASAIRKGNLSVKHLIIACFLNSYLLLSVVEASHYCILLDV